MIRREQGAAALAWAGAALALGAAFLAQSRGFIPCELCLLERWPYRLAVALGLLAVFLPRRPGRLAVWLLAGLFVAEAGLAGLHVGVEQGWWPSPFAACAAPHLVAGTLAERLAHMPARPAKPCGDPDYPFGLPISMATANLLYALALAAIVTISARYPRRSP